MDKSLTLLKSLPICLELHLCVDSVFVFLFPLCNAECRLCAFNFCSSLRVSLLIVFFWFDVAPVSFLAVCAIVTISNEPWNHPSQIKRSLRLNRINCPGCCGHLKQEQAHDAFNACFGIHAPYTALPVGFEA